MQYKYNIVYENSMLMLFSFINGSRAGPLRRRMQFQIEHGGNEPRNRQMSFVAQTDLTLAVRIRIYSCSSFPYSPRRGNTSGSAGDSGKRFILRHYGRPETGWVCSSTYILLLLLLWLQRCKRKTTQPRKQKRKRGKKSQRKSLYYSYLYIIIGKKQFFFFFKSKPYRI